MPFCQDKLTIDPAFAPAMAVAGLDSVSKILHCLGDHVAAWSRTSDTVEVKLVSGGSIFIKRYYYHTWRHVMRGLLRGTLLGSNRAKDEYLALQAMRSAGISVVRPIAYGRRRVLGFLRSCFLVTRGVCGSMVLAKFAARHLSGGPASLGFGRRRELVGALGDHVRGMHAAGYAHGALFWRNVLVRPTPGGKYEFYLLDTTRRRRLPRRQPHQPPYVRDVACLMAVATQFLTRTDCLHFAKHYLAVSRLGPQDRRWLGAVLRVADSLREHELYRLSLQVRADCPAATPDGSDHSLRSSTRSVAT